jgi:hypothetical protein
MRQRLHSNGSIGSDPAISRQTPPEAFRAGSLPIESYRQAGSNRRGRVLRTRGVTHMRPCSQQAILAALCAALPKHWTPRQT